MTSASIRERTLPVTLHAINSRKSNGRMRIFRGYSNLQFESESFSTSLINDDQGWHVLQVSCLRQEAGFHGNDS